jgi:hypothetical protein
MMVKRNNVAIKTKYNTTQECLEQCRDYKGDTIFAGAFSKGISGSVASDGHFVLSSRKRYENLFEFIGRVEQREDGIYMVGDIKPRSFAIYSSYFGIVLGFVIGVVTIFFSTAENDLRLFGFVMILLPWINTVILRKSDSLYTDLINKVTS